MKKPSPEFLWTLWLLTLPAFVVLHWYYDDWYHEDMRWWFDVGFAFLFLGTFFIALFWREIMGALTRLMRMTSWDKMVLGCCVLIPALVGLHQWKNSPRFDANFSAYRFHTDNYFHMCHYIVPFVNDLGHSNAHFRPACEPYEDILDALRIKYYVQADCKMYWDDSKKFQDLMKRRFVPIGELKDPLYGGAPGGGGDFSKIHTLKIYEIKPGPSHTILSADRITWLCEGCLNNMPTVNVGISRDCPHVNRKDPRPGVMVPAQFGSLAADGWLFRP